MATYTSVLAWRIPWTEEPIHFFLFHWCFLTKIASQHNRLFCSLFFPPVRELVLGWLQIYPSLCYSCTEERVETTEGQLTRSPDCYLQWPECPREAPGKPLKGSELERTYHVCILGMSPMLR